MIRGKSKQRSTQASQMYRGFLELTRIEEASEAPRARPSSFPLCSVRVYEDLLYHSLHPNIRERTFPSEMYTTMGRGMHATVQEWLSHQDDTWIYGDWHCRQCNLHKYATTDSNCDSCGQPMLYQEMELEYLGMRGHVDLIVWEPSKGYIVVDLKSCGDFAIKQARFTRLSANYVLQLFSYAFMLHNQHGEEMKKDHGGGVTGCSLLFINRHKPRQSREFTWKSDIALPLGKLTLHSNALSWRNGKTAFEKQDLNEAIRHRLCRNQSHYEDEVAPFYYGGCRLADVCINGKKQALVEHMKAVSDGE